MTLTDDRQRESGSGASPRQLADGFIHIRVGGTPEEMGAQHGELLRAEIQEMVVALRHHVLDGQPGFNGLGLRIGTGLTAGLMERRIDPRFKSEMKALARASDVPYADILLLNCVDDVLANLYQLGAMFGRLGCSAYAVMGTRTASGELLCGRNLDYFVPSAAGEDPWAATNHMKQQVVCVDYQPKDAYSFVSVGWPGFVGVATGMSSAGIALGSLTVSTRRNWPFATPATFLYRDVLERADGLEEAVSVLRRGSRTQANNVLIGSGGEQRACVVEFTPWRIVVREAADNWIAATNHFVDPSMARYNSGGVPFGSSERSERLGELCCGPAVGPAGARDFLVDTVLRRPDANDYCAVQNPCTIYSVMFEPSQGTLSVRVGDTPDRTFVEVPVA
ncbi:MAG: hypothetical protein EXR58_00900 [Chloroflexi bacterium]|nr:hypothetical protein [Chloroflexota bacterium]